MRLSIDKTDPGYQPQHICTLAKVTLDGVEQKRCTVADEEGGYVIRYAVDKNGNLQRAFPWIRNSSRLKLERVYGVVKIVWPEDFNKSLLGKTLDERNAAK